MTNATMIRTRKTTFSSYTAELPDGTVIDLPFEADEMVDPFLTEDGNTFRYGVRDDACHDYDLPEGVEFFTGDRGSIHYVDPDTANERFEQLAATHDVYAVDVYEHGNVMFSLSGEGPQCQFDTARGGAAIALPNYDRDPSGFTNTREAAASILTEYTAWCNGDVYGIVEMVRNPETGEWSESDSTCWGFYGYEYAEQVCREGY